MSGWSDLGSILGGQSQRSERAQYIGTQQGLQQASLLEQARQRRNQNLAIESLPDRLSAAQDDPTQRPAFIAAAMQAKLDPRFASGYTGQMQDQDIKSKALAAALQGNGDLNLINRLNLVESGKPTDLSNVKDGVSYNQMVTPDQNQFDPTQVGMAQIMKARQGNTSLVNVGDGSGGTIQMGYDGRTNQLSRPTIAGASPSGDFQTSITPSTPANTGAADQANGMLAMGMQPDQIMMKIIQANPKQRLEITLDPATGKFRDVSDGSMRDTSLSTAMGATPAQLTPASLNSPAPMAPAPMHGGLGYTPPKTTSLMSPADIKAAGFPDGTVAQKRPDGTISVLNKPGKDSSSGGQMVDNGDGTQTFIPSGRVSDGQRNAAGFYNRMTAADKELEALTQNGYDPTNLRDQFTVGGSYLNSFGSSKGQQYHQAKTNWVRANLRKESGAVIGKDEMVQEIANYFPEIGDAPAVIEQKSRNRKVVESAMRGAAGNALPAGPVQSLGGAMGSQPAARKVLRTGSSPDGRKVIQYTDGSIEYAD